MLGHRAVPIVASVFVGGLTALQSRVNGQLSSEIGNGLQAALVSFTCGLTIILLVVALVPSARRAVVAFPAVLRSGRLKWWEILGGVLGGFFVAVQATTVPLVGVAVFTVAVVAGQSGNSLLVDRVGLGPAGRQLITFRRALSAVVAVAAVAIAVANRFSDGHIAILPVVVAVLAGMAVAIQQAINGKVAREARAPAPASVLNFAFGTAALAIGLSFSVALTTIEVASLPSSPIWLYSGGAIGLTFVAIAAWAVPIIGVLRFALLSIAGQLAGAVLLDVVAPTSGTDLGWNLVLGVLLAFVAVAMGSRQSGKGADASVRESAS